MVLWGPRSTPGGGGDSQPVRRAAATPATRNKFAFIAIIIWRTGRNFANRCAPSSFHGSKALLFLAVIPHIIHQHFYLALGAPAKTARFDAPRPIPVLHLRTQ